VEINVINESFIAIFGNLAFNMVGWGSRWGSWKVWDPMFEWWCHVLQCNTPSETILQQHFHTHLFLYMHICTLKFIRHTASQLQNTYNF